MASTGTVIGHQEADETVHQLEVAAGMNRQDSNELLRQEGASLCETGQAAGREGFRVTAAARDLHDDVGVHFFESDYL